MEINLTKCRGCLAEESEMYNVFNFVTENLSLADILLETTSIEIGGGEETWEISPFLCLKCTRIVVDFYNFKTEYDKNQKYFCNGIKNCLNESPKDLIILKNEDLVSDITHDSDFPDIVKSEETEAADKQNNLNQSCSLLSRVGDNGNEIIDTQIKPEVGEFTVQNELVQLIESVVFCCRICKLEFLLKDEFLNHMKLEHRQAKIVASRYTKKTLVKLPLGKVVEENVDNNSDLENDQSDPEQKVCKICYNVVSKSELESHRDEHKTHRCHCGAKFLRLNLLVNHKKSVHSDVRDFVCKYCSKAFKTKQVLKKHVRYHTHPRSEICHICGQVFNDKSVLSTHIKLKHFPTRDFQCSQCGLKFPLKSTLEKHVRRHHTSNREKTFSCSQCNMAYYEKATLNRHIAVKHSDQPVKAKCEYCGKIFTTKGNLYKHLRTSHKYDSVIIGGDGSVTIQKGTQATKALAGNIKVADLGFDYSVFK